MLRFVRRSFLKLLLFFSHTAATFGRCFIFANVGFAPHCFFFFFLPDTTTKISAIAFPAGLPGLCAWIVLL